MRPGWLRDGVNNHLPAAATLRRVCNQGEEVARVGHCGRIHPSSDCKGGKKKEAALDARGSAGRSS